MHYLGIEIGGTKLQLGVGPGDGTLAGLWRGEVNVAEGGTGIRRQIRDAVPELLQKAGIFIDEVRAVGIGFGGPVDDATQTVIKSHQIKDWENFPLAKWIQELLNLPVFLGNDADVAGLAEALFGAGKGMSPVFYITIGSGIGGGLIINGEIYRGCGRGAAEIGHLSVFLLHAKGVAQFPLEELASGWAIADAARKAIREKQAGYEDVLAKANGLIHRLTAQHVAQAADEGNPVARRVLAHAVEYLARAICHVLALLCPRRIVIGGGVSLMGEKLFFKPLRSLVAKRVFKPFAYCYDIVPAALGEEVVVHGALALAQKRAVP